MRKILYSPGYGAGWVSWHCGPTEEKLFMLTYRPFIDALEDGSFESRLPALERQFEEDFERAFPESQCPYTGGMRQLQVMEVEGRVQIKEYDGSESVVVEGSERGWL